MSDLTAKGYECYLPLIAQRHQWKDRKKIVELPLFSGYLFVRLSGSDDEHIDVLRTAGAVRILGTGNRPERVPEQQVNSIRRLVESGHPIGVQPLLKEGIPVRVRRGSLQGIDGVLLKIKSRDRLIVSIDLLSQSVVADVDIRDVEAVPDGRGTARWDSVRRSG